MTLMPMDDEQLLRYSRHILLPQLDIAGQQKICEARAIIIGLGGLGSPVVMYLASSGVGELVLVDDDNVDASNLQRQIVHNEQTVGLKKVHSAAEQLKNLNSTVKTTCIDYRLDQPELFAQVAKATVVLDCSDNFTTRKLVNKVCLATRTPLISGAAIRLEGQIAVFDFRQADSPCYQCLYDVSGEENLTCAASGVLAPLVGVIGSLQALEALKVIAGFGQTLSGRLLLFDAQYSQWRSLNLHKDPLCSACSS